MSQSFHKKYRRELTSLALGSAVADSVEEAGRRFGWWPGLQHWFRLHERFDPEQAPFANLVLATNEEPQSACHVEIFEEKPTEYTPAWLNYDESLGWVRVTRFPRDAALNTLTAVVSSAPDSKVMQYWPQRRCTIRSRQNGNTRFAKVYPKKYVRNDRGAQLHEAAVSLWHAAGSGRLRVSVAKPQRWDSETRSLWMEELKGRSAEPELFQSGGAQLAYRMGQAAGSLTRCGVTPTRRFDACEQMMDSSAYGKELGRRLPKKTLIINVLLDALESLHACAGSRPLVPVHGDMHAGQWLIDLDQDQLGLLDFDDLAWGDPERDAAHFLVRLECEHRHERVQRLCASFLEGYEAVAGPLNHRWLAIYQAHKWLAKALKAARELRCDADLEAGYCLERSLRLAADAQGYTPGMAARA